MIRHAKGRTFPVLRIMSLTVTMSSANFNDDGLCAQIQWQLLAWCSKIYLDFMLNDSNQSSYRRLC